MRRQLEKYKSLEETFETKKRLLFFSLTMEEQFLKRKKKFLFEGFLLICFKAHGLWKESLSDLHLNRKVFSSELKILMNKKKGLKKRLAKQKKIQMSSESITKKTVSNTNSHNLIGNGEYDIKSPGKGNSDSQTLLFQ